jgi:hypothetical protein
MVNVELSVPLTFPGPETTLKLTANLELADADSVKGLTP